jgi:hypothetical protein
MHVGEMLTAARRQPCFVGAPGFNAADDAGGTAFARDSIHALKTYAQGCSAQNSDRDWSTAEIVLIAMARQEGARAECDQFWPAAAAHVDHGFRSVMLPVTSALVNTPVFATYGMAGTCASGQGVDTPVLFISGVVAHQEPPALRGGMVKAFEFLSETWPVRHCLHQTMATMSTWTDRRFFAGCTLDTPTNPVNLKISYVADETRPSVGRRITMDFFDISCSQDQKGRRG